MLETIVNEKKTAKRMRKNITLIIKFGAENVNKFGYDLKLYNRQIIVFEARKPCL